MKISIFWSELASYTYALFRELAVQHKCTLQLVKRRINQEAPYDSFDLSFFAETLEHSNGFASGLEEAVRRFSPDCVLMISWNYPNFMRLTKALRRDGVYVVSAMDNQWRGTPKQLLGILSSPFFLKPSIDTVLVAGDRQADFARKLGYYDIMYGYIAADIDTFACPKPITERDRNFLFVGRLLTIKGIEELAAAYVHYRKKVKDPWGLKVAGIGPLADRLKGIDGAELLGFIQPSQLPALMEQARCLVLPSHWEQWGVVIHEAAAAGLPVIASYRAGATTMFLRDGVNGYVVSPTPESLCTAMLRISSKPDEILRSMSEESRILAGLWSHQKLAEYLVDGIRNRMDRRG